MMPEYNALAYIRALCVDLAGASAFGDEQPLVVKARAFVAEQERIERMVMADTCRATVKSLKDGHWCVCAMPAGHSDDVMHTHTRFNEETWATEVCFWDSFSLAELFDLDPVVR